MNRYERNWPSRPVVGIPLGIAGLGLVALVHDEAWFPRLLVGCIAAVMVLTALGAFVSTHVVVGADRSFELRTFLLGATLSRIRLAAAEVEAVELEARFSSLVTEHDSASSTSKSLRLRLQVRHAGGAALIHAEALRLPQNWSPPDDDQEVVDLLRNGGEGELLDAARSLAQELDRPMRILRV